MEDLDKDYGASEFLGNEEEEQFLNEVIQGDHHLLYLDTYLKEIMAR